MNTLKTVAVLFIFCTAFACTKTTNKPDDGTHTPMPGKTDVSKKIYQDFPVMADLNDIQNNRDVFQEYISKNKISEAAADPSVTWQEMDALFKKVIDKPSYAVQYVGYIILAGKDLIADESPTAQKVKKEYTEQLITTGYRGYGLLYYALVSLAKNESNRAFIQEAAGKIAGYAANDKEAKSMLARDLSAIPDPGARRIQQKMKSNFEYIEKIASAFNAAN